MIPFSLVGCPAFIMAPPERSNTTNSSLLIAARFIIIEINSAVDAAQPECGNAASFNRIRERVVKVESLFDNVN